MTTNLLSVIEQQHKALEMLQNKLTGNVNGADEHCFIISMKNQVSYAQMERVSEALAAGKQAREQTHQNGSLVSVCKVALSALEYHQEQTRPIERTQQAIAVLQAELTREVMLDVCRKHKATHPKATEPTLSTMPIGGWKVRVRGSNQELHCTGVYDNTVFVDLPAPSTAGEPQRCSNCKNNEWPYGLCEACGVRNDDPTSGSNWESVAQPEQVDRSDWDTRGILASNLKCWHRLTEEESDELVALLSAQAPSTAGERAEGVTIAENFEITGPDTDGLVWLVLHGRGTTGKAMFNLGHKNRLAVQTALLFEQDRYAALLSAPALPATAMQLADDFAAAAVNHYSAGENDKELWQKMADARQALETKLMEVK